MTLKITWAATHVALKHVDIMILAKGSHYERIHFVLFSFTGMSIPSGMSTSMCRVRVFEGFRWVPKYSLGGKRTPAPKVVLSTQGNQRNANLSALR